MTKTVINVIFLVKKKRVILKLFTLTVNENMHENMSYFDGSSMGIPQQVQPHSSARL